MADFLSAFEKALSEATKQLSPQEKKIGVERMGQRQIASRNAKAQAYIDKKASEKAGSTVASKAGRASAKAQRAVTETAKKAASTLMQEARGAVEGAKRVAPKAATVGKAIGSRAGLATEIVRVGKLAADEEYRRQNEQAYEDLGEKNALQRAVEGGLGGVTSIYAAGKNVADTAGAYARANKAIIDTRNKEAELIARGILDEGGRPIRRQEAPAAEAALAGGITGGAAAPEPAPASIAASSEMARSPMEQQSAPTEVVPPKAVPVIDEDRMSNLFRKTTGTSFNPQSRADRGRMEQLVAFIEQDPERLNKSDTKIALDFYRTL